MHSVAIVAQGEMGANVARRLVENGLSVATDLSGRSAASRRRAAEAGMRSADLTELGSADLFLSIVPPGEALALAERAAGAWRDLPRRPYFADCNAISPRTAEKIGRALASAGVSFTDAGIIGGPPRQGAKGPRLYFSGPDSAAFADLRRYGLDAEALDAPIGAASALKMSYAGITKGMTAVGALMILAAARSGSAEALRRELEASQPRQFEWLSRQISGMIPKAYRWVAEMREIGAFQGEDQDGARTFEAFAEFYDRIPAGGEGEEIAILRSFFAPSAP